MSNIDQKWEANLDLIYLSILADEFYLQKIFYILSIIFSIYSKLRQPST